MSKSQALKELKQELHISFSQIFVYLACSLKYKLMYVEQRAPERTSIALAFGGALHVAIERYYRSLKDKNYQEPLSVLEELFQNCMSLELDHTDVPVIFKKETPDRDSAIKMGKALLKAFYENVDLSGMEIVGVELPLSATLFRDDGEPTDIKLIGVIDLVLRNGDGKLIAVDHKSASKPYAQANVDANLQFSSYAYLLAANKYVFPTAPVNCRLDVLRKLKTPKLQQHETVRTAAHRKRFAKIASAVLAGIESRVFIPNHSWMCTDCGYAGPCERW